MNPSESTSEGTLFDLRPNEPKLEPTAFEPSAESTSTAEVGTSAEAGEGFDAERAEASPITDRKRIEEQLDALKRKEHELRRALVVTDHPELAEAVRALGMRAYAVSQAESKLAQGLSKGEQRRREGIEKKLSSYRAKRDELDGQIGALETELGELGSERSATFQAERHQAMEQLMLALGKHELAIRAAGLDASALVPDLERWLPELETIAQQVVGVQS